MAVYVCVSNSNKEQTNHSDFYCYMLWVLFGPCGCSRCDSDGDSVGHYCPCWWLGAHNKAGWVGRQPGNNHFGRTSSGQGKQDGAAAFGVVKECRCLGAPLCTIDVWEHQHLTQGDSVSGCCYCGQPLARCCYLSADVGWHGV